MEKAAAALRLAAFAAAGIGSATAAEDGQLGDSSSANVTIRASVAAGGSLSGLATAPHGARKVGACLWLNTATRQYSLVQDGDEPLSTLSWTVGTKSVLLQKRQRSGQFVAARKPECNAGDSAMLIIEPESLFQRHKQVTLLIAPE